MKEGTDLLEKIEADWIIIEGVDRHTGKQFRRQLPVKYLETDNGLVLSGENLDGSPSQIHFISETALEKLNDVLGQGPDRPRCNGH